MTEELLKEIRERIANDAKYNPDEPNTASWGYEQGVLISRNEAQSLVDAAERHLAEVDAHEKTKIELEAARQLCRQYSEAIAATNPYRDEKNFSIKTGITPPEQF